jgi:hypothetical protein
MTNAEAIARVEELRGTWRERPFTSQALTIVLARVRAQAAAQEAPRASERQHGAGDPARASSGPDLGGDDE